jgi:alpha-L-fucosidase
LFDARASERLEGMGAWMQLHSRSIYGCVAAPEHFVTPTDCRYTYNPTTNRLYLHIFAWPFRDIYCPGLAEHIDYAQFLHDGSEVHFGEVSEASWSGMAGNASQTPIAIQVPIIRPDVAVPVIEIFLK